MGTKEAKKRKRARKKRKKKENLLSARTADKYELYQWAVQSPEEDMEFLADVYRRVNGRQARHFREDFCGTALLCATWLKRHKKNTAEGFDIDPEPVRWGLARHFAELEGEAERAELHLEDVREPSRRRPDIRCGHNFSYCCFKTRAELLEYFRAAYEDLADHGIFSIDVHGGPESMEEMEEEREIEQGYTYVWDQQCFWPASGDYKARILFRFEDGSEMKAFKYDWRLWSITELKDVLHDAGFTKVDSYWEGTDPDDPESGNGEFEKSRKGENCLSWIAYLIARK